MQPHGTWVLYFSRDSESAVIQSTLHIHYHSSTSIVATLVILLSATLLLMVSSSVHVWKVIHHIVPMWQCNLEGQVCVLDGNSALLTALN